MVARPVDAEFRGARLAPCGELREKGIRDLAVLRAFEMTPRHAFVPTGLRHRAYEDAPLPIGNGQTISQPWVHATYLELLRSRGSERVLEIGTGPATRPCCWRISSRRCFRSSAFRRCSNRRAKTFSAPASTTCRLLLGDGTIGWREYAPYDAILVAPVRRRYRSR